MYSSQNSTTTLTLSKRGRKQVTDNDCALATHNSTSTGNPRRARQVCLTIGDSTLEVLHGCRTASLTDTIATNVFQYGEVFSRGGRVTSVLQPYPSEGFDVRLSIVYGRPF